MNPTASFFLFSILTPITASLDPKTRRKISYHLRRHPLYRANKQLVEEARKDEKRQMVLQQKIQQNVSTFFNELLDDFVILCAILFWVDVKSHCLLQIGSANKTVSIGIEQIELQGSHQSARRKSNRRGKQEHGMKKMNCSIFLTHRLPQFILV